MLSLQEDNCHNWHRETRANTYLSHRCKEHILGKFGRDFRPAYPGCQTPLKVPREMAVLMVFTVIS